MFQTFLSFIARIFFPSSALETHAESLDAVGFYAEAPRRHNDTVLKNPKTLSPFIYRDVLVQTTIHLAKYRNRTNLCRMLGGVLWDIYGEDITSHALLSHICWSVVPIPLSPKKRRMRGYNQSEEIARGFCARCDSSVCMLDTSLLTRVHTHESQARTMSKRERRKNVAQSFFVPNPVHVAGKHILLIDDVVTTGATLHEAARALRKSGARRIICITVAH
jgi:ComF family protein